MLVDTAFKESFFFFGKFLTNADLNPKSRVVKE